jgi:hypothetical protein
VARTLTSSPSSAPVGGPYRARNLEQRGDHWYQVIARLAPGVGIEQARSAMRGLAARLADAYPAIDKGRDISVFAQSEVRFHPLIDGALRGGSVALVAIAALVLLLACSNLGNLLLARGASRSGEIAVRQVLGSSRLRIARLFADAKVGSLTEAPTPMIFGAAEQLGVGAFSIVARTSRAGTAAVGAFSVLAALLPARRAAKVNPAHLLRND